MRLARSQHAMLALITDPAEPGGAEDLVCGSPALPAAARVELYRRSYQLRLLECLRASYPGLRHALTPGLFDAFGLEYLAAQPPRSYTLSTLGVGLGDYLDATRPEREPWTDFIVDLARLEWAFREAYDAPGPEGQTPPSLPAAPDPAKTVEPLGCLRLLHASCAVGDYLLSVRAGGDPPLPADGDSYIVLNRRDYVVALTTLDGPAWRALEALTRGASLGEAGVPWARIRAWTELGYFKAVSR